MEPLRVHGGGLGPGGSSCGHCWEGRWHHGMLPCTSCWISAQCSPSSSSTRLGQRSGQTGFYPKPQPSAPHSGSGHARTPQRQHCVPWGGWQGHLHASQPHETAAQPVPAPAPLPGQLCQEWAWLLPSPGAARVWSQVAASQVPRQLKHLQG